MPDPLTPYEAILAARSAVRDLEDAYLRRFGWGYTCNTPSAHCMWRRDFAAEDAEQ